MPDIAINDKSNDRLWETWMILTGLIIFSYVSGRIRIQIEKISDETPITVIQVMDTLMEGIDSYFIEHNTNATLPKSNTLEYKEIVNWKKNV